MSVGLIALLDDVAALAKVAAASIDDIAGQAAKAGTKAAGIVIDDTAVTPRYVVGFAADREIPIVAKIARGSIINKLVYLLPAALILSAFAPWAIPPLLLIGGAFLCYEGAEKVYEKLFPHAGHHGAGETIVTAADPKALEDERVAGAIKTDFILSAEIMAIALATMPDRSVWTQAIVLAFVAVVVTVAVYGLVALIVKADDAGVALARNGSGTILGMSARAVGRGLVVGMPKFLAVLSVVGTAAMVWVGGGIVVYELKYFGLGLPYAAIHGAAAAVGSAMPVAQGFVTWLVEATGSGIVGLAVGFAIIPLVPRVFSPAMKAVKGLLPGSKKG